MEIYLTGAIFVLGLIIGSFLNVVILRHKTGRSINGRSGCMSCGKKLSWFELVPVLSWIFQAGKCRGCGSKISIQYPLVELSTALLFTTTFYFLTVGGVYNAPQLIFAGIIMAVIVAISAYDLKHMIIPDEWSAIFAVSSLIFSSFYWFDNPFDLFSTMQGLWHILAAPIFFLPFWALWFFSKGTWMGLGDGKLAVGIGWFLGLSLGATAIVLSFWIGAVISLIILLITRLVEKNRRITMKSEIPFGPFLIAGTLITFFIQMDLMSIMSFII